jgi:PAS domain S-box-containing protein
MNPPNPTDPIPSLPAGARGYLSPFRTIVILTTTLFFAEFAVNWIVLLLPDMPVVWRNATDAALMVLLASPALYLLVVRSLHDHIRFRIQAETALRQHSEQLETMVACRTADLRVANEGLHREVVLHQRTDGALRESEARYRGLFSALSEGFSLQEVICDSAGKPVDYRMLEVNAAFERQTGLTRDEVIGRRLGEVLPAVLPFWIKTCGEVATSGRANYFSYHSELLGKDFDVVGYSPAPGQVATLFLDVTERVSAEKALENSERRHRALFENMSEGCGLHEVICDEAGNPCDYRFIEVNPAFERLTGLTREKVVGRTHREVLPNDDLRFDEVFGKVALTGEPAQFENYSPALDRHFQVMAYRPAPRQFAVIFLDISERKRVEEALREIHSDLEIRVMERTADLRKTTETLATERRRFSELLDLLPAYVVLLSPDQRVPFANRFFRERFGGAQGRRCFDCISNLTGPCENCESFRVLRTNEPAQWEWTGPDGRHYDIFDFPFTDSDGSPLVMEMGIDISERKRAEAALQEANETLEQRVNERTAELRVKNEELSRFNNAAVNRELRMIELKKEVNELCRQVNGPRRYPLNFETESRPPVAIQTTKSSRDP